MNNADVIPEQDAPLPPELALEAPGVISDVVRHIMGCTVSTPLAAALGAAVGVVSAITARSALTPLGAGTSLYVVNAGGHECDDAIDAGMHLIDELARQHDREWLSKSLAPTGLPTVDHITTDLAAYPVRLFVGREVCTLFLRMVSRQPAKYDVALRGLLYDVHRAGSGTWRGRIKVKGKERKRRVEAPSMTILASASKRKMRRVYVLAHDDRLMRTVMTFWSQPSPQLRKQRANAEEPPQGLLDALWGIVDTAPHKSSVVPGLTRLKATAPAAARTAMHGAHSVVDKLGAIAAMARGSSQVTAADALWAERLYTWMQARAVSEYGGEPLAANRLKKRIVGIVAKGGIVQRTHINRGANNWTGRERAAALAELERDGVIVSTVAARPPGYVGRTPTLYQLSSPQ